MFSPRYVFSIVRVVCEVFNKSYVIVEQYNVSEKPKMNDRVLESRLGTSSFNEVFLKIIACHPSYN